MPAIYPDNFEIKIGFDKIREILSSNCLSTIGKEKVEAISFLSTHSAINYQTELSVEFVKILREHDNFPTSHFYDLRTSIAKVGVEGTFLEVQELFNLRRSLETLKNIVNFFKGETGDKFPNLKELAGNVVVFNDTLKAIDDILTKHGTVKTMPLLS
jgi:DNA mismatch repair protein MutS2